MPEGAEASESLPKTGALMLNGMPSGGFLKLGVPCSGVPLIRIIVYWGLCWGPLTLGNYQVLCLRVQGTEASRKAQCGECPALHEHVWKF